MLPVLWLLSEACLSETTFFSVWNSYFISINLMFSLYI